MDKGKSVRTLRIFETIPVKTANSRNEKIMRDGPIALKMNALPPGRTFILLVEKRASGLLKSNTLRKHSWSKQLCQFCRVIYPLGDR